MQTVTQPFNQTTLPPNSEAIDPEVFVAFKTEGEDVEEYRALKNQLALRWFKDNKSLLFTSTRANQGASQVVANLAIMFAQSGYRTLLIDAHIRQPSQHQLFRLNNTLGLSDKLARRAKTDVVHTISNFPHLNLLTAGTSIPNPLELLGRQNIWAEFEQDYEVVLIDAPAAMEYSDAQYIASQVGGGVIVARNDETRIKDLEKVKAQFATARAETIGVVLTDF